jgi:hypothetical protein
MALLARLVQLELLDHLGRQVQVEVMGPVGQQEQPVPPDPSVRLATPEVRDRPDPRVMLVRWEPGVQRGRQAPQARMVPAVPLVPRGLLVPWVAPDPLALRDRQAQPALMELQVLRDRQDLQGILVRLAQKDLLVQPARRVRVEVQALVDQRDQRVRLGIPGEWESTALRGRQARMELEVWQVPLGRRGRLAPTVHKVRQGRLVLAARQVQLATQDQQVQA